MRLIAVACFFCLPKLPNLILRNYLPVVLSACLMSQAACVSSSGGVTKSAARASSATIKKDCQLTLQFALAGDKSITMALAEKTPAMTVMSEEVCIRTTPTSDIVLPRNVRLFFSPMSFPALPSHSRYLLCEEAEAASTYFKGDGLNKQDADLKDIKTCLWNGHYRDSYPFSFIFRVTEAGQKSGRTVGDHMQLIHVFRNGALAYAWRPGQSGAEPATMRGKALVVPGTSLSANRIPHLADFDLRVYDSNATVDSKQLAQAVEERVSAIGERAVAGVKALAGSERLAGGELDKAFKCFEDRIGAIRNVGRSMLGQVSTEVPQSPDCSMEALKLPTNAKSLVGEVADLEGRSKTDLTKALSTLEQEVDTQLKKLGTSGQRAKEALLKEVEKYWRGTTAQKALLEAALANRAAYQAVRANLNSEPARQILFGTTPPPAVAPSDLVWAELRLAGTTLQDLLRGADEMLTEVAHLIDDVHGLMSTLTKDVVQIAKDPAGRLEVYERVAGALVDQGDFFDPYASNPPPIDDEAVLPMSYSDGTQFYALSAWLGVPVRLQRPSAEFSETTAIPIVDLVGVRNQIGKTRFGDIRLGLGGAVFAAEFFVDNAGKPVQDPVGTEQTRERVVFAAQMNASIASFRVGFGYILTHRHIAKAGTPRMRLFLGIDIVNLLSGKDSALF